VSGRGPGSAREAELRRQQEQRRRDRRLLIIVAAALVLLVVAGGVGYQLWQASRLPSAVPEVAETLDPVAVETGEPVRLGAADAPHTLTAYVDFHCPGCAGFEEDYGPGIFAAVHAGRVVLEVHPLSFHDAGSPPAANAFGCAAESGFGIAYYRGLFANRDLEWRDEQLLDLGRKVAPAAPAGFAECVTSRAHARWLESITDGAARAGVTQTPTILLDGDPVNLDETPPEKLVAMFEEAPAR